MKRITVNVTDADIATGRAGSCVHCPIALAVNRVIPEHWFRASVNVFKIDCGSFYGLSRMPKSGVEFISSFDRQLPVEPFKFTVVFKTYEEKEAQRR